MKMVSKLTMALLAGALALPITGFAAEQAAVAPKTAVAKPQIDAPDDCKVTGRKKDGSKKEKGAAAVEKRKQIHAKKGVVSGEEKIVVHNLEAAHEHGRQ